jgi:hypothetical protein
MPQRNWQCSADAKSRVVLVDSFTVLRYTAGNPLVHIEFDVERIVLDRSTSASDYLALLAELPHAFIGDVLLIREDESGFLSAMGRGGDRILYALSAQDVAFYLETHHLIVENAKSGRPVLQFRPRVIAVA